MYDKIHYNKIIIIIIIIIIIKRKKKKRVGKRYKVHKGMKMFTT